MDYKKLGFKCGIEAHQQLEGNKLFCNCPSIVHDKDPDIFFERKLMAVTGEMGKIDLAAKAEVKKNKINKYEACSSSSCLLEMDEEPPHQVNHNALDTALEVAMLMNMKIVDEVEFMRKIVVDGSNVSGFQRTAIIGMDGYIDTSKGKVKIESLFLEEEAAQKIKEDRDSVSWRLDRLGVPLLEVQTDAGIKGAEHAKEVASKIGMILRSTGKVKRGIGTIRQDVNVSIKGHPRIEIKGFQELKILSKVVETEIKRQQKNMSEEAHVRRFNSDGTTEFMRPMPGGARMYPETDVSPVKITKSMIKAIKIPELISDRILKYEKEGINPDLAIGLVKNNIQLADYNYRIDKNFLAHVLIELPKEIKKRFGLDYKFQEKDFNFVLVAYEKKKITKEAIIDILISIAKGEDINLKKYAVVDDSKIDKEIKEIVEKNKGLSVGGVMGIVMSKYRGKVDGNKISKLVNKYMN